MFFFRADENMRKMIFNDFINYVKALFFNIKIVQRKQFRWLQILNCVPVSRTLVLIALHFSVC